jgi:hypothetical protein
MNELIAGVASGVIMACVFVCVLALTLVSFFKESSMESDNLIKRISLSNMVFLLVILPYPMWGIIGVVLGLLYKLSLLELPRSGLGSPNLWFTIGIITVTVVMIGPFAIMLKRIRVSLLVTACIFIGIFGWFMPYFAI